LWTSSEFHQDYHNKEYNHQQLRILQVYQKLNQEIHF
jgi:hypothetical protein